MDWFETLVGFPEENAGQVCSKLSVEGEFLTSAVNGGTFRCGALETPSLAELRERTATIRRRLPERLRVSEVVGDVQRIHQSPEEDRTLFQVASQFNLLEMIGPGVTPEKGVGIYGMDRTQGPACAIACGAATILRNYFVEIDGGMGQTAERQIDCLRDLGDALGNAGSELWTMRNGYALPTATGLEKIAGRLGKADETKKDALRGLLRIGVHWDAGVTLGTSSNTVSQVFCSALPVAYCAFGAEQWEPFARLVLEATYEATFHAALLNRERTGSSRLYLTLVGGGAFGNRFEWITEALERSLRIFAGTGLDVRMVSYGGPTPGLGVLLGS